MTMQYEYDQKTCDHNVLGLNSDTTPLAFTDTWIVLINSDFSVQHILY